MVVIGRSIDEIEVGQRATYTRVFTEDEVKAFASLSWDHNPHHTHAEFARKTKFKRPIVHGLLVAAAFTHFGGDFFPGPAILATRAEMDFKRPVFAGETVTFTAEVTEVDRKKGRIVYVTTARNEQGEEVCRVVCYGIPTAHEVGDNPK
ncbi:MAG TPA: MaoC family dehydratase [bacterium]|nr:MaoC family dehydratase [bacterium]